RHTSCICFYSRLVFRDWFASTGAIYRVPQGWYTDRFESVVGRNCKRKGSWMMRKTSLVLLGAVAGAAVTFVAVQPSSRLLISSSARAAQADTYRQLNLFGDIFERVRSHYVEKPDESKLVESAINGMLNGLDPHSSYMDTKSFKDMQIQTRG